MYKRRDIQGENIQKNADDENFIYSYQQLKFAFVQNKPVYSL